MQDWCQGKNAEIPVFPQEDFERHRRTQCVIDGAMPWRGRRHKSYDFKCCVAGVGDALTDAVLKDDAAVAGGVIHGRVVAMNHEGGTAEDVGGGVGIEMRDDGAFAAGIIEEGLNGVVAARQRANALIVLKIRIVQAGSIAGVAGADELTILAEVPISAHVAPHAGFLSWAADR